MFPVGISSLLSVFIVKQTCVVIPRGYHQNSDVSWDIMNVRLLPVGLRYHESTFTHFGIISLLSGFIVIMTYVVTPRWCHQKGSVSCGNYDRTATPCGSYQGIVSFQGKTRKLLLLLGTIIIPLFPVSMLSIYSDEDKCNILILSSKYICYI